MKKISSWLFLSILIVSLFGVSAVGVMAAGPSGSGGTGLFDLISNAVDKILSIGSLEFLFGPNADNKFFGFVRIAYAIMIFSLLYLGLNAIPNMSRQTAITVGIILAIVSAVFTPTSLLAAFGTTYATLFALIFIVGPIAGILYLLFATPTPSRLVAGIKIVILSAVLLIVNEISHWAITLASAP